MKILSIDQAVSFLLEGAVIAYPTDTIWGLGCIATNENSVKRLIEIKNRDENKGLIVLVSSLDQVSTWIIDLSYEQKTIILEKESPCTFLIPATDACPKYLIGGYSSLAIRLIKAKNILLFLDRLGFPLVSTSANISGENSITNVEGIMKNFSGLLDGILLGECTANKPSTIVDLLTNQVIRN